LVREIEDQGRNTVFLAREPPCADQDADEKIDVHRSRSAERRLKKHAVHRGAASTALAAEPANAPGTCPRSGTFRPPSHSAARSPRSCSGRRTARHATAQVQQTAIRRF